MKANTLNFELYNTSDMFLRCKIRLEILMAIYGDDAKVYDLRRKNNA